MENSCRYYQELNLFVTVLTDNFLFFSTFLFQQFVANLGSYTKFASSNFRKLKVLMSFV